MTAPCASPQRSALRCLGSSLAGLLPRAQATVFREQIEILLDLLGRAGLDTDDPDVCRDCVKELRFIRHRDDEESLNGSAEEPDQSSSHDRIAGDLDRAG